MEEPIVIELFKKLFKPLIKLMGNILCIPQLLLKGPKLSIIGDYRCNNIIEIVYSLFFLLFYNFIYLNFHIIFFLKNFSLVESKFELFIAFLIFYSFTATFYYAEDIRFFILKDLGFSLLLVNSVFQYVLVVLSFFVRLDKESLRILSANDYRIGIQYYSNFGIINIFLYFWETVFIVFLNLLIILHAINPLSLFRVPVLVKIRDLTGDNPSSIIGSALFIIVDYVFLVLHLLNAPFILSFLKNTLMILSSVFGPINNANWAYPFKYTITESSSVNHFLIESNYRRYSYNVYLILDSFLTNYGIVFNFLNKYIKPIIFAGRILKFVQSLLKYTLVFVFSAINLIFFWRIKQLIANQSQFKREKTLSAFLASSMELNVSGVTDLIFLFVYLINRLIITNYFFLNLFAENIVEFSKKNLENLDNQKVKANQSFLNQLKNTEVFSIIRLFKQEGFFDAFISDKFYAIKILNFNVFFSKTFDLIISLISIVNVFSPTFYIKLYNYLAYKQVYKLASGSEDKEKVVNPAADSFIGNFYLFPLLSVEFNRKLHERFEKDFEKNCVRDLAKIKDLFMENYIINANLPLIQLARKILFQNVSKDLFFGIFLVLNLITILDPFSGLLHVFNIFKFLGRVKMSFSKFNENQKTNIPNSTYYKISTIIESEIKVAVKAFFESLLNFFVRIPLILVSIVLFPFNLLKAVLFCFDNYYLYFYRKIKQNNNLSLRINADLSQKVFEDYSQFLRDSEKEINSLIALRKDEFIKSVFTRFLRGWATLLKVILIHLSVIRGIYLYYDLFSLKKFYDFFKKFTAKINKTEEFLAYINFMNKQNDNKSIYEEESNDNPNKQQNSNSFVDNNYSEIKILRLLNSSKRHFSKKNIFIFYDYESWLLLCKDFFSAHNSNNNHQQTDAVISSLDKIDIESLKKLIAERTTLSAYIEGVIDDNFNQLLKEFYFYPIIVSAFVTNPLVFYFGFIALKSNDYNIFRQRKFIYKVKLCAHICLEYLKIIFNILKVLLLLITFVKIPDLLTILYYYSRTLFSKNPDCYFKCLLDEHYEGEFSKDLNMLVLQALDFYFVSALILLNFLLVLRIPSITRRVGRFVKSYITNLKFKYFGNKLNKKEKASPLETTKINCFATICEFLKPREIGKIITANKTINKRIEKKLIWDNLFANYYLVKIKAYLDYLEFKDIKERIERLERSIASDFAIYEYDEEQDKREKQRNLAKAEADKAALEKSLDQKLLDKLSKKFAKKNYPLENLNRILQDYNTKHFEGKVLCQKAQNSFDHNLEVPEKLRDKFLGLRNVVIEETFESIFKSPHLILLPFKLLSIPVILIGELHVKFYISTFGRSDAESIKQSETRVYNDIIAENLFYNIQLYGLWSLLKIFIVQITVLLTCFDWTYRFLLRLLSLKWLLRTKVTFDYEYDGRLIIKRYESDSNSATTNQNWSYNEIENVSFRELLSVAAGHFVTLLVLLFHILIALAPTIYFKWEGILNIYHKAFLDDHRLENHFISRTGRSPFLSALNWWILCEETFNALWQMSLASKFYFIVGNYFLNFVSLIITIAIYICYTVSMRFEKEKYPYYAVIAVWLELLLKCIFSLSFLYSIIYPHIFLFKVYMFIGRRIKILNNKILLNLVSFVVILFPFYLNFKVKFSLFRFITINTWAVTSFMRLSKLGGKLN